MATALIHWARVIASYAGPAVAVAWMIGLLHGTRRARPDWLESIGRLIGVVWIVYWGVLLVRGFF